MIATRAPKAQVRVCCRVGVGRLKLPVRMDAAASEANRPQHVLVKDESARTVLPSISSSPSLKRSPTLKSQPSSLSSNRSPSRWQSEQQLSVPQPTMTLSDLKRGLLPQTRHMVSVAPDMRYHVQMRAMPDMTTFDKDIISRMKMSLQDMSQDALKRDLKLAWLAGGPYNPFPWDDPLLSRMVRQPRTSLAQSQASTRAALPSQGTMRPSTSQPALTGTASMGAKPSYLGRTPSAPTRGLMSR